MKTLAPATHGSAARLALALAIVTALLNGVIALAYGWYLPGLFRAAANGENVSPEFGPSLAIPLLLVGEAWYLTPLLWLVVMLLCLRSHASGVAVAAIVVATLSLVLFAVTCLGMAAWMH